MALDLPHALQAVEQSTLTSTSVIPAQLQEEVRHVQRPLIGLPQGSRMGSRVRCLRLCALGGGGREATLSERTRKLVSYG